MAAMERKTNSDGRHERPPHRLGVAQVKSSPNRKAENSSFLLPSMARNPKVPRIDPM